MNEDRQLHINELTPEEMEILRLAATLREMGKDPAAILKLSVDAGATLTKVASLGKEATGYLRRQWQVFEREYKNARDGKDKDG